MRAVLPVVIDCDTCPVRQVHCDDCMVTALSRAPDRHAGEPDSGLELDASERRAVGVFVRAGLIHAQDAAMLTAQREPDGRRVRAVG